MSPDPTAVASTNPTPAPPPAVQSPPPPAPAPAPSTSAGGVGVTPPGGASSPAVPPTPTAPQIPADVQAQLDRYRAMEGEYQQLNQHRHLIPLGMEAYRRAQQAQPNPQSPPAPQHPWGIPQFDERLLDFVGRDQTTGELALKPGAPPDALLRVQEYQAKVREANNNFLRDPVKALEPIIKQMFGPLFQEQFGQQYGQIQTRQDSERIIAENRDWLYAKDQGGNPATRFNPATGRNDEVLSPLGEAYSQLLVQATQMGISNPANRHQYAVTGLQNLLYQQQRGQQAAQQQGVQQQQQVLQQGQTAAAQLNGHNPNVQPPAQQQPLSLREQFEKAFNQNGLTDDVVARQVAGVAGAA